MRRIAAGACAVAPATAHAVPIALDAPLVQAALGVGLLLLVGVLWLVRGQLSTIAGLRRELAAREAKLAECDQALGESAKRLEELHALPEDMSLRDALTGLYNRRCLDQVLLEAWKAAVARREPLSLLMIDIDQFKQLNDKYGHAAGDACLREVANRLQRHATTLGGVVARYGGEDFVAERMRAQGLRAEARRKFEATTNPNHSLPVSPDLLQRDFSADAPNRKWVGDITCLPTTEGWLYLAVFIDLVLAACGRLEHARAHDRRPGPRGTAERSAGVRRPAGRSVDQDAEHGLPAGRCGASVAATRAEGRPRRPLRAPSRGVPCAAWT